MRILVTGSTGQIGSATAERLSHFTNVVATDRSLLDISKPETISATLDEIGPELVINAAAYTAVDRAELEPDLARIVNTDAPAVMADWCAGHDVPFIHFSTDYVFDGSGERPWSESDTARPLSTYGNSKLAGEQKIAAAGGCSLIIRTSWVYAARGTNFLRRIATLAQSNRVLRVVSDQAGAPTSASLVAVAIRSMLQDGLPMFRDKAGQAQGMVHLAASGEASWYEFATEIVAGLQSRNIPLAIEFIEATRTRDYPQSATRPLNSRFDLGRLAAVFGIIPAHWKSVLEPELDEVARELSHR
jgi:dTDP-4-dehydrorhamnose reductase